MGSSPGGDPRLRRGPIAWLVNNRVTPNLLMVFLILGGLLMSLRIKQEVFPDFTLDQVSIRVPYPGASPEEVERGILLVVEEAVRGLEGVDEVTGRASEGSGTVTAELLEGSDAQRTYQEIRQAVDRIRTFPVDAEEPQVNLSVRRREVMTIQVYGAVDPWSLREVTETVRDRLLQTPGVTQVELENAPGLEIRIEVPQETLRTYGLTLDGIARILRSASVELPGGSLETAGGELLIRVNERRDWAREFAEIPVVAAPGGAVVKLGDIALIEDGFEDAERDTAFNGKPSLSVSVYRVGDQTPIGVSEAVRGAMGEIEADLPEGVDYAVSRDSSTIYRQRLELLLKNAFLGLALVLCILGLFLEVRLAFWVTMGIPTSFLGAMLFLPYFDVTINMISMFAFIIALGIVVDDAIIAGENIHEYRQRGMSPVDAAIRGAQDVALPVGFSILTNVVAFLPLMFVPGFMGKIWRVIPLVVITIFLISWVESLLILPGHLLHAEGGGKGFNPLRPLSRAQRAFGDGFLWLVRRVFGPVLSLHLRLRYLTVAVALGLLLLTGAYAASGRLGLVLMPKVESDRAVVTATLPLGSPEERAEVVRRLLTEAAGRVGEAHGGEDLVEGIRGRISGNEVEASVYLTAPEVRPVGTAAFTDLWREEVGEIAGLQSLKFESDRGGPGRGAGVTVELSHRDYGVLDAASADLAERIAEYGGVRDVDDGYTPGKSQLDFRLRDEARALGLTASEIARQVRNAFYGAEALRQQRGRHEVKVMVRYPEADRVSEFAVEEFLVRTPDGRDVPLREIADVVRGRAYTTINRRDGRRAVTVTADVRPQSETNRVLQSLADDVLPGLVDRYPGLAYSFEGRQAEMREGLRALGIGFALALVAVYFLLAVPFRSYTQPVIVMMAIPFGIIGAAVGHWIMDYSLSMISMMGIVALSGVVVNDSLVMVDYANRRRREGMSAREAIHAAGIRRFRPILLTTLTTFGGLAPMIFETSRQARFLIPMALSLGFGIVFATFITLVLIPCLYMVLEDFHGAGAFLHHLFIGSSEGEPVPAPAGAGGRKP